MSTPVSSRNNKKSEEAILFEFDTFDKENNRLQDNKSNMFMKKKKESTNCFRAGSGESGHNANNEENEILRHKIVFLKDQNKELQNENSLLKKKVMKFNKKLKSNSDMINVLRTEIIEVHNENKMLVDDKIKNHHNIGEDNSSGNGFLSNQH